MSKLEYLAHLDSSGELERMRKHGLISHTPFALLQAHRLLKMGASMAEAATALSQVYGFGKSGAYRYLHEALKEKKQ